MRALTPLPITLLVLLALSGCTTPTLRRYEFHRLCMGVHAHLVVYATEEDIAFRGAASAFSRLESLDQIMSDYRPNSELSGVCQRAGQGPVQVSDDLLRVMDTALRVAEASDGAFDPTIGPLTRVWRDARDRSAQPSAQAWSHAASLVGHQYVRIKPGDRTIELLRPGMVLDLGGVAKGDAAEQAVRALKEHGLRRSFVALAGDIALGDAPPGKQGWKVRVEHCGSESRTMLLANTCISTSGQSEQSITIDSQRVGHVLDARARDSTGMPHWSATVIARHGAEADALATALCVTGNTGLRRVLGRFPGARAWVTYCDDRQHASCDARAPQRP